MCGSPWLHAVRKILPTHSTISAIFSLITRPHCPGCCMPVEQKANICTSSLVFCKRFSLFHLFVSSSSLITSQAIPMRRPTCYPILRAASCGDPLSELDPTICLSASPTKCSAGCCQRCVDA